MNKPLYIIAHRCNDLNKPVKAMKQGANAIECDVWFDDEMNYSISHEGIEKQDIDEWLHRINELRKEYKNKLSLIIFDIKKCISLINFVNKIHQYLPLDLKIIYSVNKLSDAGYFGQAVQYINENELLSIDEEEDPEKVKNFFISINCARFCYGIGIDVKFPDRDSYHQSITYAKALKQSGYFELVYVWTVEKKNTMKRYLIDDGVDGIMVNLNSLFKKPVNRVYSILEEYQIN